MTWTKSLLSLLVLALVAAVALAEAVPPLVPYGGVVVDDEGRPRSGRVGLSFALYAEPDDEVPLWVESHLAELGRGGSYRVMLGGETPGGLPVELFTSGRAQWIGVRVDGGEEEPRRFLGSVGYALQAANAAALDGLPASAFQQSDPVAPGVEKVQEADRTAEAAQGEERPVGAAREARREMGIVVHPGGAGPVADPPEEPARAAASPLVAGAKLNVAGTIGADALQYNTPRTHYLSIGGAAFRGLSSNVPHLSGPPTGLVWVPVAGVHGSVVATFHLPDGAILNQIVAKVYLPTDSGNMSFTVLRQSNDGGLENIVHQQELGGVPALRTLTFTTRHIIDNENYSYWVRAFSSNWTGDDDLAVQSVRFRYTVSEAP